MSIVRRTAVLAVLGAAALPSAAFGARADEVLIVNGPDQPVPTSLVGTPGVNVANSPTVRIDPDANTVRLAGVSAPTPFQDVMTLEPADDATSFCGTTRAPAGTVVTVQHVIATVNSTADTTVRISYLPGANNGRRLVTRLIQPDGPSVSESMSTLMHLGMGEPSLVFQACLEKPAGLSRVADVIVSGTRQPLP